ncbi:Helitron helicase-like protein [Phytophthora palmivora]|uniref:Helitron helicase-like protein n=1 Tax=Phytophthora palmivora TaxID=4796 RepID=A0A2P4Y299_9STRA|nr:Helitron helicase-like protein [Phytophthora palmivora]
MILRLQNLVRRGDQTKLTAFFNLCTQYTERTGDLLYKDAPVKVDLVHVLPQESERFYLRQLRCLRRSHKSFEDIRAVNGVPFTTLHWQLDIWKMIKSGKND